MHMIFADNTTQYLDFKPLTCLPDKLTHPQRHVSLQNMITVFCNPNKMVFDFELCMAPLSIIHVADWPAASKMLPA